jgi:heme/copper-type cytochrome/quinol oxidase subunit 2
MSKEKLIKITLLIYIILIVFIAVILSFIWLNNGEWINKETGENFIPTTEFKIKMTLGILLGTIFLIIVSWFLIKLQINHQERRDLRNVARK